MQKKLRFAYVTVACMLHHALLWHIGYDDNHCASSTYIHDSYSVVILFDAFGGVQAPRNVF